MNLLPVPRLGRRDLREKRAEHATESNKRRCSWRSARLLRLFLIGSWGFLPLGDLCAQETVGDRIQRLDEEAARLHPELFNELGSLRSEKPIGFRNIYLTTDIPGNPSMTIVLEFPGRIDAVGHATKEQWRNIFHNEAAPVPDNFGGFGSRAKFDGPNDKNTYQVVSTCVNLNAQGKPNYGRRVGGQRPRPLISYCFFRALNR